MIDTNNLKRAELVPLLTEAAVNIAMKTGIAESVDDELGEHLVSKFHGITVYYRTPKAMLFTAPTAFGIDVWHGRKCFSVAWTSQKLKDFRVINIKRGPWIPLLLAFSETL